MNENGRRAKSILVMAGMILLIVLLVLGVNAIFSMLDTRYPFLHADASASSQSSSASDAGRTETGDGEEAPRFCPACGKQLREGFQWGQYCPYCGEMVS